MDLGTDGGEDFGVRFEAGEDGFVDEGPELVFDGGVAGISADEDDFVVGVLGGASLAFDLTGGGALLFPNGLG